MAFRDWLVTKLGGTDPVGDPDEVVEAALVELWQSEMLRSVLATEGVDCHVLPEASGQATREHLRPMARLMTARTRPTPGPLPHRGGATGRARRSVVAAAAHDGPWGPPTADGAVP